MKIRDYLEDDFSGSIYSKWLRTMISKSPKDRDVLLPNGRTSWLVHGGESWVLRVGLYLGGGEMLVSGKVPRSSGAEWVDKGSVYTIPLGFEQHPFPIGSMYCIFTYIDHKNQPFMYR